MNKYNHESHHFDCECLSEEHIFRILSDNDLDSVLPPELHISVQLKQHRSFFKRLIVAVKYLFKYESRLNHWDITTIQEQDLGRLITLLHQHRVKVERFYKSKSNVK